MSTSATTVPLDEVMLAMDVADTLRRRQHQLAPDQPVVGDGLIDDLRDHYRRQGIEVPDAVLAEGVAALEENRFAYAPPPPGLWRALANIYISRNVWGRGALAFVIVAGLGLGGYYFGYKPYAASQREAARVELSDTLPAQLDALYNDIYQETKVQQAANDAEELVREGKAAAAAGDRAGALGAVTQLTAIRDTLSQSYTLRVVNRPGAEFGFWRFPENNTDATNYYIVVEAVDDDNNVVSLPILNEKTGTTETVARWALRVPEPVYRQVAADQQDDGIIEQNRVGQKEDGFLETNYYVPVLGGALTRW